MSDSPLLKTPGEMISDAREAKELTLAQLSDRTKIPPAVLKSLELDEYHKISGPLYIKSFLRTCAVDLGLDPQVVLSLYNQISGENKSRPVGSEMVWDEEEVKISRVGLPWLRIILAAGVVAVLIGVGLFAMRGCGNGERAGDDGSHPAVGQTEPDEAKALVMESDPAAGDESRFESLMSTSTEEELRQRSIAAEEAARVPDDGPVCPSFVPDSLALFWILSSDAPAPVLNSRSNRKRLKSRRKRSCPKRNRLRPYRPKKNPLKKNLRRSWRTCRRLQSPRPRRMNLRKSILRAPGRSTPPWRGWIRPGPWSWVFPAIPRRVFWSSGMVTGNSVKCVGRRNPKALPPFRMPGSKPAGPTARVTAWWFSGEPMIISA